MGDQDRPSSKVIIVFRDLRRTTPCRALGPGDEQDTEYSRLYHSSLAAADAGAVAATD